MRSGTEQLLLSDAVDRSIDRLDLSALEREAVFLDTTYILPDKGTNSSGVDNYVNSAYIISTLRQKLITSGCLLKPSADEADYIIEARVGALGTDALEVTYGIPASNALSTAATLLPTVPAAPTIPEIAIGKRNSSMSTSKIVVFAYHRETGKPVWQSGAAVANSDAKDSWLLGAGPFQKGSIYDGTQFAGSRLRFPWNPRRGKKQSAGVRITDSHQFTVPERLATRVTETNEDTKNHSNSGVIQASHEKPTKE